MANLLQDVAEPLQGVISTILLLSKLKELNGNIYLSLIGEFYSNFHLKSGSYISLVKRKLFTLDEDLFFFKLEVSRVMCLL
ncbi:hypothetical protein Lal_00038117 [Lupinus albus]|nr:hypothetical protein Lal_00038117 [Lupinus albus]